MKNINNGTVAAKQDLPKINCDNILADSLDLIISSQQDRDDLAKLLEAFRMPLFTVLPTSIADLKINKDVSIAMDSFFDHSDHLFLRKKFLRWEKLI